MSNPKLTPLRARLREPTDCRRLRSFRSTAEGVLHQGDIPGLMAWLQARRQQGLCRGCEVPEAAALTEAALVTAQRQKERLLKLRDRQAEAHRAGAAERQAQLRQALAEREARRRARDPHAHVRAAVTNPAPRRKPVVVASAAAEPILAAAPEQSATSPQARGRHNGSRPLGECGQKIGRKLDKLLAEIRGGDPSAEAIASPEPEVQAPEKEAPAGLDALLAEIQSGSAAPAPAEAAAEPEAPPEPPMPMVEPGPEALQQEPPMPVVLPEPAEQPAPAAELSPKARAVMALAVAISRGEQVCCMPQADAVALLEALL